MKYNTVLFTDKDHQYYIGTNVDSVITEIQHMDCSDEITDKLDETFEFFEFNEFYIVEVEYVGNNLIKITPITSCKLTKTDSIEELVSNLYDMTNDELLKMFNTNIPKKYLTVYDTSESK